MTKSAIWSSLTPFQYFSKSLVTCQSHIWSLFSPIRMKSWPKSKLNQFGVSSNIDTGMDLRYRFTDSINMLHCWRSNNRRDVVTTPGQNVWFMYVTTYMWMPTSWTHGHWPYITYKWIPNFMVRVLIVLAV